MIASRAALVLMLTICSAVQAAAQRPARPMGGRGQGMQNQERANLEDEVRRGFARAVRERVGLNDDQMLKLGSVTRKYEDQRRQTQMDERDARMKLQALVLVGTDADSTRITGFITQLMDVRKRRLQIDEAEQKELAGVMSPMQLARFLGLQEQVRRRLEQMRPGPGGPPGDMPPRDGPPGEFPRESTTVRVNVSRGTRILLDGVEVGTGRTAVKMFFGPHRLTMSAPGCKTAELDINVTKGMSVVTPGALSCP